MKLSEYITQLQEILESEGDIKHLITSIDDEGNGFNEVYYGPEIRWITPYDENLESPIPMKSDKDTLWEWACDYGLDGYYDQEKKTFDYTGFTKVVLL